MSRSVGLRLPSEMMGNMDMDMDGRARVGRRRLFERQVRVGSCMQAALHCCSGWCPSVIKGSRYGFLLPASQEYSAVELGVGLACLRLVRLNRRIRFERIMATVSVGEGDGELPRSEVKQRHALFTQVHFPATVACEGTGLIGGLVRLFFAMNTAPRLLPKYTRCFQSKRALHGNPHFKATQRCCITIVWPCIDVLMTAIQEHVFAVFAGFAHTSFIRRRTCFRELHARHVPLLSCKNIYIYKQEFAFKASNVSNASNRAQLHQASMIPLRVSSDESVVTV